MKTPGIGVHTVYGLWGAALDDLYAVGSITGRNGFIWHYDGKEWRDLPLPEGLPLTAFNNVPGFFKVWGQNAESVYIVGGKGQMLHGNAADGFKLVSTEASGSLFTVHGDAHEVIAVGGAQTGVFVTGDSSEPHGHRLRLPAGPGRVRHAGPRVRQRPARRDLPARTLGRVAQARHRSLARPGVLHALWDRPKGGVWAVGGNVISGTQGNGGLVYGGEGVPAIDPTLIPDADAPPPAATCPEVDPEPGAWNRAPLE